MQHIITEEKVCDELVEIIIKIDLKLKTIIYCNKICEDLKLAKKNMRTTELAKVISCEDSLEMIRSQIMEKNYAMVNNVSMTILGDCQIRGNLHITYAGQNKEQLYLMLKYNIDDIQSMFIKNRCFEAIYKLSFSYPFRLDIQKRELQFIRPISAYFNVPTVMHDFPEGLINSGTIHEEDIGIFRQIAEKMYQGKNSDEVFRTYTEYGKILWYQATYIVNQDKEGNPVEIIGEFVNVQEKKELEQKLYIDELTGCLNKTAFQSLVEDELHKNLNTEQHVLMIIDVDNFKSINDNLGHQFGDSVLREAGIKLKKIFREKDYVGRIGGDEFMVFMKSVDQQSVLEKRAAQIVQTFDNIYKGNARTYRTTASIGVAIYPQDGEDFKTLYNHADIALYNTKSTGKNGFTFYQSSMVEGNMNNTTPFDAASRALSQHFDRQVIAEVFTLLTEARDYDASLNKVLALLGLRFNAERCYIFEFTEGDIKYLRNTYEWCAEGITPEIDNLQFVPQDAYQPLIDLSNEEGVFYCNDLDVFQGQSTFDVIRDQGILSFLLSFNKIGNKICNVVGFDDCTSARVWSSIEIATLMHASKIINQFLRYMDAMNTANKVAKEKMNVLDELYSYAYIIDEQTCEIMYYNQEIKEAFPEIEVGKLCFDMLHGRTEKCSNCPIIQMKKQKKEKYRCIRKVIKTNKTMLVSTTDIGMYEGRKCTFFSCCSMDDFDEEIM